MAKRLNLIDIIKGVMIIFIIITHFRFVYPDDYRKFGFFYYVDMAVPVFMIITGYLTALSYERNKIDNIKIAWSIKYISPKLLRFLIPFAIAFAIEVPVLILVKGYNIGQVALAFFEGGVGPGSYYTPVMIQLIFVAPAIYQIIKMYDLHGVILCYTFVAVYEAVVYCLGLPTGVYRILVFRYVSLFSFGCFIAIGKRALKNVTLTVLFVIGIAWQTALNYIPLQPVLMNQDWARVNYLSSLFVVPILYLLIKKWGNEVIELHPLQDFGKASYNIFLVQMVFYGVGISAVIYKYIEHRIIQLLLCILVCLVTGYCYYTIENQFTSRLIKKLKQ